MTGQQAGQNTCPRRNRAPRFAAIGRQGSGARFLPHFRGGVIAIIERRVYAQAVKTTLTPGLETAAYDIQSLLRERFRIARGRNPRFSLRSFAKQLGIDHSTLSQVLRGRRRLSRRSLHALGERLGLAEEVLRAHREVSRKRTPLRSDPEVPRSYDLDLHTFQMLSVWYHHAILELLHIEGFQPDSRWIASVLGIETQQVNIAVQRLLRLGLLEMKARKHWVDRSEDAEFHSTALTEAASDHVSQGIHDMASEIIKRIPGQYRQHHHAIVAMNSGKLPQFRILMNKFIGELRGLISEDEQRDDVYQLEISLFPLTTLKTKKGGNHE